MKHKSPLPLLRGKNLASIVGFGLYWSWVDCTFFRELLFKTTGEGVFSLATAHLFVMAIALVVSAVFLFVRSSRALLAKPASLIAFAMLCALGSLLIALASLLELAVLLLPAVVVSGLGMGIGVFLWGYRITSFGIESASVCIPGAIVAAALFGMLTSVVIPLAAVVMVVALPLLSAVMFLIEKRLSSNEMTNEAAQATENELAASTAKQEPVWAESTLRQLLNGSPLQFMLLLFTFCVAFGVMQYLLVLPYSEADTVASQNILVRGIIALVVLIGFGVFSWKPDSAYKIGLLLTTAGFLTAPFTKSIAFSGIAITAGYTCFDMMGWIVVAALLFAQPHEGLRFVALSRVASIGGVFAGSVLGSLLTPWAWQSEANLAITATAIAYLLVAATVLLFNQGSSGIWQLIQKEPVVVDAGVAARKQALCHLSASFHLTPRETEVMDYLALGRSLPWIAERLGISTGTVRTHTRKIYEKLGVHSRQSLMDTIDALATEFESEE